MRTFLYACVVFLPAVLLSCSNHNDTAKAESQPAAEVKKLGWKDSLRLDTNNLAYEVIDYHLKITGRGEELNKTRYEAIGDTARVTFNLVYGDCGNYLGKALRRGDTLVLCYWTEENTNCLVAKHLKYKIRNLFGDSRPPVTLVELE
jgi:hypothetical protein